MKLSNSFIHNFPGKNASGEQLIEVVSKPLLAQLEGITFAASETIASIRFIGDEGG